MAGTNFILTQIQIPTIRPNRPDFSQKFLNQDRKPPEAILTDSVFDQTDIRNETFDDSAYRPKFFISDASTPKAATSKTKRVSSDGAKTVDPASGWAEREMKPGDSISKVLKRLGFSEEQVRSPKFHKEIAKFNKLQDPNKVRVGQRLKFPPAPKAKNGKENSPSQKAGWKRTQVETGDNLSRLLLKGGFSLKEARDQNFLQKIAKRNNLKSPDQIVAGTSIDLPVKADRARGTIPKRGEGPNLSRKIGANEKSEKSKPTSKSITGKTRAAHFKRGSKTRKASPKQSRSQILAFARSRAMALAGRTLSTYEHRVKSSSFPSKNDTGTVDIIIQSKMKDKDNGLVTSRIRVRNGKAVWNGK